MLLLAWKVPRSDVKHCQGAQKSSYAQADVTHCCSTKAEYMSLQVHMIEFLLDKHCSPSFRRQAPTTSVHQVAIRPLQILRDFSEGVIACL